MFSAAKNPYDDIVAKATDENQTSENWAVLSTVWDKVNDDGPNGARNCIGAIQKRLQHRNANVQLYALTLVDSLINNCGVNLHREVSSRAFTQTLSRLVSDRTTHDKVKKRTMHLLKGWTETFKKDESLGIVEETYETLRKSHNIDDPAKQAQDPVPLSVLKREEEEMQRAIAESEELARRQQAGRGTGYVPASSSQAAASTSYAPPAAAPTGTNFFTQADGKALPEIQNHYQQAEHNAYGSTSAPPQKPANAAPSRVKALYDFEPQEEGELGFRKGDIIRVVNSAYEGWWKGELDGRIGIFPLTYIEIIPDPTPESIARDAETEASVFSQSGAIDRLLAMLSAADAQGSSISDDDELMELYQQCILLRPKIVKLLDKYSQKQKDLSQLHDKFKIAKGAYDQMLEESYQRNSQARMAGQAGFQQGYQVPGQAPPQQQPAQPGYGYQGPPGAQQNAQPYYPPQGSSPNPAQGYGPPSQQHHPQPSHMAPTSPQPPPQQQVYSQAPPGGAYPSNGQPGAPPGGPPAQSPYAPYPPAGQGAPGQDPSRTQSPPQQQHGQYAPLPVPGAAGPQPHGQQGYYDGQAQQVGGPNGYHR